MSTIRHTVPVVLARDVHLVVPTRGTRTELLHQAVESLLGQTIPVRITVVTDGEPELVGRPWRACDRVRVLAQTRRGLSAAINEGWTDDEWRSEFTGWLGDDDALPPQSVEAAVAALERCPAASMVHGRCLVVGPSGEPVVVRRNGALGSLFVGYGVNLLAQPGTLFRTDSARRVGGLDESLLFAMDVDFFIKLKRVGGVTSTSHQLGVFRAHPGGLSTGGLDDAFVESRHAMRRSWRGPLDRVADVLAWPATRVISRVSSALPPSPSRYWAPPAPQPSGSSGGRRS